MRASAPWWTPADSAELNALGRVLVDEVFGHREAGCERCANGESCAAVRGAIEAVVEWREQRELVSRAHWIRDRQDFEEAARRAA